MAKTDLPLLRGTLDLLVLKTLSWGPVHGYGISSWLERQAGGRLTVDDSALYQSLHRLEGRRLIEGEWGVTETNRRARFYRLTADGERQLQQEATTWRLYADIVAGILAVGEAS